jgi:hypothetical protein
MEKIKVFLEREKYSIFLVFLFLVLNIFFFRKVILAGGYIINGEYFTLTNFSFFLNQFLHAWNNYAGLGNSNIGFLFIKNSPTAEKAAIWAYMFFDCRNHSGSARIKVRE